MRRALRLLPLPLCIAMSLPARAARDMPEDWSLCPIGDAVPAFADAPTPPTGPGQAALRAEQPTDIEGDSLQGAEGDNTIVQGNVALTRGDQFLGSDRITFNNKTDDYVAEGNVRYQDSGLRMVADRASGNQDSDRHRIEDVRYQLMSRRGNGVSDRIELAGSEGSLYGSTYSTCDPDQRAWELKAQRIDIDTDEGMGVAHNATLRIGKVPVLYLPWFMFPIDDRRRTGLLYPTLGSSSRNGFDYRQPVYLNLAPNYDATITPRLMTNRGVMLGAEFRYLNRAGRGTIEGAWMPNDRLRDRDRGVFRFSAYQNLDRHWRAISSINWISDTRYVEDFSNTLNGVATYRVSSTLGLVGRGQYWNAGFGGTYYQLADYTLSKGSLPYNRLPRAYFSWEQPFSRWFSAGIDAEAVRFQHQVRDGGSRLDLKPYVTMPLEGASWFLKPTLAWRYTGYELDRDLGQRLGSRSPSRSLPIATLDAGLYFDRDTSVRGHPYLQTLEPRIYYLRAPYRDQSDLPLFDTQPLTFSWGQLFRDNRYSGADRQTDANQLTLALTSRFIRQSDGHEKLSASLGQIRYFDDSRVTVPGETPVERGKSAWVAEASYMPNDRWTISGAYQWDPKFRRQDLASLRTRYLLGDQGVVNFGYRYRRNLVEQADVSFLYPLTPSWSLVGRYYYSILDHKPLETIAGVQWDSCCMAVRIVARRYVRNRTGDLNNALQVEFELKGLGSAGPDTERTLRRAILGYYRDDLYLVPPEDLAGDGSGDSGPDELDPTQ